MMMHKRISVLSVAVGLVLTLSACTGVNGFEDYVAAEAKTDAIETGEYHMEMTVENTFDEPSPYQHIESTLNRTFDSANHQSVNHFYIYQNELGLDTVMYEMSQTQRYLKLPMLQGYMDLSPQSQDGSDAGVASVDYEQMFSDLNDEWLGMMTEDNVFVGEKVIIENADGKIKATEYTIKPTSEQLQKFAQAIIEHVKANKEALAEQAKVSPETLEGFIEKVEGQATIDAFESHIFVDVDGYIIEKTVDLTLSFDDPDLPKQTQMHLVQEYLKINQDVEIELPTITPEMIQDLETMPGGM